MKGGKAPLPPFSKPTIASFRNIKNHKSRLPEYRTKVDSHNAEHPNDVLDITTAGFLSYVGSDGNLSHDQRKEVLKSMKGVAKELKQEGKTQAKIAGMLGVSQNTVSDWLTTKRRNNIGTDNVSQADCRVKINPKAKPLILERVENGETPEQVAAELSEAKRAHSVRLRPSQPI